MQHRFIWVILLVVIADAFRDLGGGGRGVPWKGRVVPPIQKNQGQSVQTRHSEVPVVLYLKCVVAGLMALILVFGVYFLASVVAVEMIGFTIGFSSPISRLVFAFVVFGAGFLWELRRLTK